MMLLEIIDSFPTGWREGLTPLPETRYLLNGKELYEIQQDLRSQAIQKLGGKCSWENCVYSDLPWEVLEIHHVLGNGKDERYWKVKMYSKIINMDDARTEYALYCPTHHKIVELNRRTVRKQTGIRQKK